MLQDRRSFDVERNETWSEHLSQATGAIFEFRLINKACSFWKQRRSALENSRRPFGWYGVSKSVLVIIFDMLDDKHPLEIVGGISPRQASPRPAVLLMCPTFRNELGSRLDVVYYT